MHVLEAESAVLPRKGLVGPGGAGGKLNRGSVPRAESKNYMGFCHVNRNIGTGGVMGQGPEA